VVEEVAEIAQAGLACSICGKLLSESLQSGVQPSQSLLTQYPAPKRALARNKITCKTAIFMIPESLEHSLPNRYYLFHKIAIPSPQDAQRRGKRTKYYAQMGIKQDVPEI
jgi:hypothetical protein